jgi:tol-pal system protein YbgF
MRRLYPFIFAAALLLPACSIPEQLSSLDREQRTLKAQNTASRSDLDSIRSSLADTQANVDQLRREVRALQEKVEEVRYQFDRRIGQVGQSSHDGDQRVKDLEARVAKLSDELKAHASELKARDDEMRKMRESMQGMAADTASVRAANEARERAANEAASAKRDYEEALRLVERKDYRAAIPRLKEVLRKYPDNAIGEDAQYWLGESFYGVKEYDQAILEFDGVRRRFPKGEKVPAALLKQGLSFAELNDRLDARLILQELVDRFPDSEEAAKAKQRLKTLESSPARPEPPAGRDAPGTRTAPPARR